MSDSTIGVTYDDVEILYSEDRNQWTFELRGVQRWADSLTNAKAAIDKPAPKNKKPFERFKVYGKPDGYGDGTKFEEYEVTSIAGKNYRGFMEVWTQRNGGNRRKTSLETYIADTPANHEGMVRYAELARQINALREQQRAIDFTAPAIGSDVEVE